MTERDGTVLTVVCGVQAGLITAKLIGVVDLHWVIVLVPLWGAFVSAAAFLAIFSIVGHLTGRRG